MKKMEGRYSWTQRLGAFALAMLMEQYWLGAVMAGASLLLYALYHLDRNYRRRELQKYLQQAADAAKQLVKMVEADSND